VKLFTDAKNAADLAKAAGADQTLAGYLQAHLGRLKPGDYSLSWAISDERSEPAAAADKSGTRYATRST